SVSSMSALRVAAVLVACMLLAACGTTSDIDSAAGPTSTTGGSGSSSNVDAYSAETPGCTVAKQWSSPPAMQLESGKDYQAVLHTNKGDMTIDLFESEAPNTVNNFVFLAEQGYYSDVPFHRVIKSFMVQT